MKVSVIRATTGPMHAISEEAGMCYGKDDYNPKRVERCLMNGHTSVTEHVSATFRIEGISRSCLAQLTRHRMASFSVMSQRYCEVEGDDWYVIPPSVIEAGEEVGFVAEAEKAAKAYHRLLAKGVKKEAQWEIRELANAMVQELKEIGGEWFKLMKLIEEVRK